MRHFFELVLDVHLELQDFVGVVWMVDLLGHLRSFLVHASFEKALGMVELVLDDIRVELGELIVHIRGTTIVLDIEIAICKQGKSGPISG